MSVEGKSIRDLLSARFPDCNPQLLEFASGAFMIDFIARGETYVIESIDATYAGLNGYGLSRQSTAAFGWEGVERAFETRKALERALDQLLLATTDR